MIAAIAAQGFELVRRRVNARPRLPRSVHEQPLEPLLPGFLCASPAMMRVVEQIQRLQGNELTVLDHRRERHRQGARRARDSRRLAAQRCRVSPV